MKYFFFCIALLFTGCIDDPLIAPAEKETVWIDALSLSDTIITNVNNQPPLIYYAAENWQSSPDTNISHGYRFIGVKKGDTVLVKQVNDSSTNYQKYICGNTQNSDTLLSQNFLDTSANNPVKKYIQLK